MESYNVIKTRIVLLLGTILVCPMLNTTSSAATITLSDHSTQTITGQNFTFAFHTVELSDGTDGIFTLHVRGDYSEIIMDTSEFLTWDIDGIVSGTASPTLPDSTATVINTFGGNDVEWIENFTISGILLSTITVDSFVTISLNLSDAVNIYGTPFVNPELTYSAVPEPATIGLLGIGSLSLLRKRRK